MSETGTGWAFNYDGPINPQDCRACDMCNAAASGQCPKTEAQHGNFSVNCVSCQAARQGYCHNHCGVSAALTKHSAIHVLCEDEQACFGIAKQAIEDYLASLPSGQRVVIKATEDKERPDWPLFSQLKINISVYR